jgi:hypothetical protein
MQVQVNVIFDLETEADRAHIMTRIDDMLRMSGVKADMVPLPGNGTTGLESPPLPDEAKAKDQAASAQSAANLKARQQAAANARAAKQSQIELKQQAQAKAAPPPPPDDLAGGTNGAADSDADDDALGLNSPSMSPGEAKDAALALVREAYSAGHVAQVKALQKELGVAKFYDVDVTTGHAFYQRVMKLAHEVGIRR